MTPPPTKAPKSIRYTLPVVCALAWVGAFVSTHLPPDELSGLHASDKVLHMVGYGGLTTLLVLSLASLGRPRNARIVLAVAALLAYGAFDELTQPIFLRTASFYDWLADAAGTILAVALCETLLAVLASARRRRSHPA